MGFVIFFVFLEWDFLLECVEFLRGVDNPSVAGGISAWCG
jgi:hypothetical protein